MKQETLGDGGPAPWKREAALAAAALSVGLVLPFAIYFVGRRLIGDYSDDGGAMALAEQIWRDAAALRPAAVILVLSPYAVLQLARLAIRAWTAPRL